MWIKVNKEGLIKPLDIAKQCAKLASIKKAIDPIILEVKGLTDISDYFVICSGTSSRQIKTIADYIVEKLGKKGISPLHYEVDTGYTWVVLDYIDVIMHIFNEVKRGYYRLEQLWGDAKTITISSKKSDKP